MANVMFLIFWCFFKRSFNVAFTRYSPVADSMAIEHIDLAITDEPKANNKNVNTQCFILFIKAPSMPIGLDYIGLNVEAVVLA